MIEIAPRKRWLQLDLRELWAYRELLYFLAWRDVKIRYKQTLIGVAWAVLQPALTTLVFTLIFSGWVRMETGDVPYPVFALSGLLIWLFIFSTITFASNSFVGNTNLVTKVYFPRIIVPVAAILAGLFDLVIGLGMLSLLIAYFRIGITPQMAATPIFVLLAVLLATGLGVLLSALNVKYRDIRFALPFLLQVWMIASPIFYPSTAVAAKWRPLFAINPLVGIIEGFRSAVMGSSFDWNVIGISAASTAMILVIAVTVFRSMEDDFADVI
ncbi:MAG TPA: ABC transporter permease [Pyrinomonadaceae bacterium]|nr:ABC transporter permease [Pyrinomonadaceae bacterium]